MLDAELLQVLNQIPAAIEKAFTAFVERHPGHGSQKVHGRRGGGGTHSVITETDKEQAKILLTQGVEPEFKPQISNVTSFAPGKGIEREGIYVAKEGAFSKGSYGDVRLHMEVSEGQLKSPKEMTQLGRNKISDVLNTENGAVTVGAIPKTAIKAVEVYNHQAKRWDKMSPAEYMKKTGIENTQKLPTVTEYKNKLKGAASKLKLSDDDIEDLLHDYNRGTLEEKVFLANEL